MEHNERKTQYHWGWRTRIFLGMTLFVMLAIFLFSHQSGASSGGLSDTVASFLGIVDEAGQGASDIPIIFNLTLRNLAHICIYVALGCTSSLFYASLLERQSAGDYVHVSLLSIFTCVAYAASDELHQYFIPARACRVWDVMLDATGALMGILVTVGVWYLCVRLRARARENKT